MLNSHFSGSAIAWSGTEAEWRAWPDFCKAGYLTSYWGPSSPFRGKMSDAQVSSINSNASSIGIPGVHHFCKGMTFVNRAKLMGPNDPNRVGTLREAIGEIQTPIPT